MMSTLEIFGLSVGLIYDMVIPFAAYFLFRRPLALRLRHIALGVVGYSIASWLHRAIVGPAVGALFDFLVRAHFDPGPGVYLFLYNWLLRSAAETESALICSLLLFVFAPKRSGLAPGAAYAIGAGGRYCFARAVEAYVHLRWALSAHGSGRFEWWADSPELFATIYSQGIPHGVGTVAHFLVAVGLSLLIWKGVRERRWAPVRAAILVAIVLEALFAAVTSLPSPSVPNSPVSPEIYDSILGLAVVALLYWRAPILNRLRKFVGSGVDGEAGLLSVWRDQAGRRSGD
jgi:uncharacterized membrane protein YhfC